MDEIIRMGLYAQTLFGIHGFRTNIPGGLKRNARLDPEWSSVKRQTLSITFKAIAGLLEYQGLDDLYRIYAVCQRDGTDFNLAYIPATFTEPERTDFDKVYMRKLYDFGFEDAKAGYHWAKEPPMLVGQEATPAKSQ
jgi:hypothetical protein